MSAMLTKCPRCGTLYIAGIVGMWMFPPHSCATGPNPGNLPKP